jgi:hypothetical protein
MSEESALTNVLRAFGPTEQENVRLALANGGVQRVSDLRELTFEDYTVSSSIFRLRRLPIRQMSLNT